MPSEPLDADLSAIIAASADGIVVVDDRGVIRFANPAAESLFERPAKDLLGRRLGLPVATGEPAEIDLVHQGGETVVVEMLSTDASWQGQPARLAILRDVTARRRAEDDLRRALELRDDVAEIVSHELRSPLTSIIGFASTLAERSDALDREAIREIAQRIEAVGSRMERLVQDLSTVTRLQAGAVEPELRPVEVCSLISRIVGDLGERGAGIVSRCRPGAAVLADADHLERILINYLDNAIRHGEGTIGVDVEEKLPWVQVRVRDRGPGVAPELVPQLFDRLTRPKPPPLPRREGRSARRRREPGRGSDPAVFLRPTGSGLGLSIVWTLAALGGGEAWFEANHPRGACFAVRLPAADWLAAAGGSLACDYFMAPDDASAAATLGWAGGPGVQPDQPLRPGHGPFATVGLDGLDPVIVMGELERLLTGKPLVEIVRDLAERVVSTDDEGDQLVVAMSDNLQTSLASADRARLREVARPLSALASVREGEEPGALAERLSGLMALVREGLVQRRRLYCWVSAQ